MDHLRAYFSHFRAYLLYRFYRIYRFKWLLSNRFYRRSINWFFFIDRSDNGHLSTSAGACLELASELLILKEKGAAGIRWKWNNNYSKTRDLVNGWNYFNKTGLQPVSRPVEQILVQKCVQKMFKKLMAPKLYKVQRLWHCQTCFRTSGKRIGQIWPDFHVVCTFFPGVWVQGVHFWGQKKANGNRDVVYLWLQTWVQLGPHIEKKEKKTIVCYLKIFFTH